MEGGGIEAATLRDSLKEIAVLESCTLFGTIGVARELVPEVCGVMGLFILLNLKGHMDTTVMNVSLDRNLWGI